MPACAIPEPNSPESFPELGIAWSYTVGLFAGKTRGRPWSGSNALLHETIRLSSCMMLPSSAAEATTALPSTTTGGSFAEVENPDTCSDFRLQRMLAISGSVHRSGYAASRVCLSASLGLDVSLSIIHKEEARVQKGHQPLHLVTKRSPTKQAMLGSLFAWVPHQRHCLTWTTRDCWRRSVDKDVYRKFRVGRPFLPTR